jgi:hypothetical protein
MHPATLLFAILGAAAWEASAASAAARDSCRQRHHLLLGAKMGAASIQHNGPVFDTLELDFAAGILTAYRTHFAPKLGIKIGSEFLLGQTEQLLLVHESLWEKHLGDANPDSARYYQGEVGETGVTFLIGPSAQLVIGPFGRFNIEPGAAFTWVVHTADKMEFATKRSYPLQKDWSFVEGILGASLYLGSRDQLEIAGAVRVGISPSRPEMISTRINAGVGYAYEYPRRSDIPVPREGL